MGPGVEGKGDGRELSRVVLAEIRALAKVLTQQPIRVLVRSPLPWTVGVAEVDRQSGLDPQTGVLGHLCPLIPRQRPSEILGYAVIVHTMASPHRLRAVTSERRSVLHSCFCPVTDHPR